ncbi:alpha/beta hydrolase [Winogradskyella litoriviva]|uniref:Alpha/beta hydrolase n=1 Tax=Winogradskyella litoriviva TaxID=1220182 RepID=A0ABX2E2T3_9FLAO|nr:alpha/beta hydrolase-fold protein [Winogradskyella litoriviva]NRD22737.1 alpha/beta hydrolase [Winogradskyella litoriviva]
MKNLIFILFLCFSISNIHGQTKNDIVIGKIETIESKVLNEQRRILVYVPENATHPNYKQKSYPVVYLLDGDAHFYSVVGLIKQLSSVNGNTLCPKMIVVGISNTNRTRDLTPTKGERANSGGGENFMSFIKNELIPHIDSNYPTLNFRTFIGHSLGGLTVMNTLLNQPDLFNAYVAIDPSMWYNNKNLLSKIKTSTFNETYKNKTLFLGIANTMHKDMDTIRIKKDTTASTRHIRAILELNMFLKDSQEKHLSFKSKYYEDDDHGSVPLIAEYDALRYIFKFHRFKLHRDDYLNPEVNLVAKVEAYYKKLSQGFGIEIKPDEEYVNNLGYQLLNNNAFKKSEQIFKLNIKNYPESFNVYDSIGDLYMAIGDKEKAIENFKKSVFINEKSYSKAKLLELEKD